MGTPNELLCIDVHLFTAGKAARTAVRGTENSRRYDGLDESTPGTSRGLPATAASLS